MKMGWNVVTGQHDIPLNKETSMKYTFEDVTSKPSKCNWKDISKEKYRTYHYPNKEQLFIDNPIAVDLRPSNGHVVVREDGKAFYVPPVWLYIEWENKSDVSRAQW